MKRKKNPVFDDPLPPPERGWLRILFGEFHPSLDPNQPAAYLMEVSGFRTDGVRFTVVAAANKTKLDLVTSPHIVMRATRDLMMSALQQLQTFKDCSCTLETSCPTHRNN